MLARLMLVTDRRETQGRDLVDGRAAAYVCRDLVCERPVSDAAALRQALAR